ncbi:MAG TPA: lysylphosphatidylglycerol synthase transmembrane domain-containing protein, partial [Solirubrobacter sp.]
TSAGRPGLDDVALGLASLGVSASSLADADQHVAGVFGVSGRDADGRPLLIKVYGRDAYDRQLLARVWRLIWYRRPGPSLAVGQLGAAEHEAFVTLLAARGGVAAREVETAGETSVHDALLVLRGAISPLDAGRVGAAWDALARLAALRIAHQRIEPSTVVVAAGGRVGFVDFGVAAVGPDAHQLGTDRAQLFVTSAVIAGEERALSAAFDALGAEGLAEMLPYLQAAAFPPSLRRALKAASIDVDELRKHAAERAGVEPPELVKLRRVSLGSVLQIVLLVFAASTILTIAGHVDWDEVGSELAHASWGWLAAALVVAQLPRLAQAAATLGTVPVSLAYGPVYALHLASGYMNIALPSSFARMAVSVRFFQRQGLSVTVSVASGVIDMIATAAVQGVVLVALLVFSEATLSLDLDLPTGDTRTVLWILVALVAVVVAVGFVGPVRRVIVGRVRAWWPDVRAALIGLRASNKLALLVLGNLAAEALLAIALGLIARALGYHVTFAELLVIQTSVALFSGLIPVPGGIGVAELGLTVGLVAAGLTPEAALAAAMAFRIATFYLPPLWGFFALSWLQRGRYL